MPQFDFYSFSFQIFLVIIFFVVFYAFNTFYTVKHLATVLKMRELLKQKRKDFYIDEKGQSVYFSRIDYTYILTAAFKATGFMK